ncbi:cysteine-rich receptor-like protein kinase 8 [Tanacetum coccineum]
MIALNAKNKLKIVTEEFTETGITLSIRALWEKNNDMIISWILNVVVEQISNNLKIFNSTSKLWSELQEQYSEIDGYGIYQLTYDLIQLKQLNCAVEVYYPKLKGFWDELDALEGLDFYDATLPTVLPTVVKAYGMVRHEEKQREGIMSKPNTPAIFSAFSNNQRNYTNTPTMEWCQNHEKQREGIMSKPNTPTIFSAFSNNQRNYTNPSRYTRGESSTTAKRRATFKKGVYCGNCSKEGHTKAECYKLVGYLVDHLMHSKFPAKQPPKSAIARNFKFVNMVMGQTGQLETPATQSNPSPSDQHVSARMDQLQNQINQVLMMLQNKDSYAGKIYSTFTKIPKFIASIICDLIVA